MLWNYCCKRVVWGLSGEVKMGGYYHYIGTLLWSYQKGWRGHNCTCHNWPFVITHLPLSSSLSVLLTHFASHSSSSNCSFLKYFPPKFNLIQEWSSMESSSYENWDEIEMLFGHLVIGNLQLVIGNRQLVIGRRQWKKDNW